MKNRIIKAVSVLAAAAFTFSACATQTYKDGYFLTMVSSMFVLILIAYANRNMIIKW